MAASASHAAVNKHAARGGLGMTGLVLVTGATGYLGSRLAPRLLAQGYRVRCLIRDRARLPAKLVGRVDVVVGDLTDPDALAAACDGVDQIYYLVHAMRSGGDDFRASDQAMATAFAQAAAQAGVRRIIYLGGLGDPDDDLSEHLRSRQEVGRALAQSTVPVLEFRAAVIVGSGSASFEMLRSLTERVPVMICPRWVRTRCQPIGVADVLAYLMAALRVPDEHGVFEIGGADVLSYADMMRGYAAERGLSRRVVIVPVLTPRLSSMWVDLVTPVPAAIARPLIEGLFNEVIVRDDRARAVFGVEPAGYHEVVRRALRRIADDQVESVWCSSFSALADRVPEGSDLVISEGLYIERHRRFARTTPARLFAACCALGGREGWAAGDWLWKARGVLDRLCGGVGMRRGRHTASRLAIGDPVDWWRVEALQHPTLLRLRAEMKLPGRGWLQFRVAPQPGGASVEVCAFYAPRGFWGWAYWYATKPLHRFLFPAMAEALVERAEQAPTTMRIVKGRH